MSRYGTSEASHRVLGTLLVALAAASCASPLAEGEAEFKKGQYATARSILVGAEPDVSGWSDARRAEYALYRGLTHGALGDRAAASLWLREAKAVEDAHPGTLGRDDQTRLRLGFESLEPAVSR